MSRVQLGLLAAIAACFAVPAYADGCCRAGFTHPHVIYEAPEAAYAPPVEAPVIQTYRVNQGPYVTGLDVDTLAYPQPLFYPAEPARVFPYVGLAAYGPRYAHPYPRHYRKRVPIWK